MHPISVHRSDCCHARKLITNMLVYTEGGGAGSSTGAGKPISFLSTNEIVVNGKKQWAQWAHDHFQHAADGWSHDQVDFTVPVAFIE